MIRHAQPLSFARAVNLGIHEARYWRVLLLNNDMIVEPGFIAALDAAFQKVPDLFCATAQILFPPGIRREETGKAVWRTARALDFPCVAMTRYRVKILPGCSTAAADVPCRYRETCGDGRRFGNLRTGIRGRSRLRLSRLEIRLAFGLLQQRARGAPASQHDVPLLYRTANRFLRRTKLSAFCRQCYRES